ncbi:MAG: flavin reductase family protein [Halobacteriota archaeon]|uniref:flavin reductase family protein n=1 Tax=Natronomonas sp. TaxID=2184060 RepID=UPI0039766BDB
MIEYDAREIGTDENARIIKTAITPRPIAWISTVDDGGIKNLAPFSSYNYVGSSRPVLMFSSAPRAAGDTKDTVDNVLATEEFAVNVVTEPLLETMDKTAASLPSEESEFDFAGIERAECRQIGPPRVADAAVTIECTLYDVLDVYDRTVILGDVRHYHVSEDVLTNGKIDSRKLPTVGRLGGPYYTVSEPVGFERQF